MAQPKRNKAVFSSIERNYWEYYRELEDDFFATRKYVSFCKANSSSFSMEFLKLFQAVCSEIDVVGRAMAAACNPRFKPSDRSNNIKKWWYEIQHAYHWFECPADAVTGNTGICLADSTRILLAKIEVAPWHGFETEWRKTTDGKNICEIVKGASIPAWWSDYNAVKHSRMSTSSVAEEDANYSKANLWNLVNSFAALNILEEAFLGAVGTQSDLEAFANHSILFSETRYVTTEDLQGLFA